MLPENFLLIFYGRAGHKDKLLFWEQSKFQLYKLTKNLGQMHHDEQQ
jgi:hypothetical protein